MMHAGVFNGEVGQLSQLSVICPEKYFEPHPRLLYFQHAIPLVNFHPELVRPVDDHVGDVNCLQLGV